MVTTSYAFPFGLANDTPGFWWSVRVLYLGAQVQIPAVEAFTLSFRDDRDVCERGGETDRRELRVLAAHAITFDRGCGFLRMHQGLTGLAYKLDGTTHQAPNPHQGEVLVTGRLCSNVDMSTIRVHFHGHQPLDHHWYPGTATAQITHQVREVLVENVHAHLPMVVVDHNSRDFDVLDVLITPHFGNMLLVCLRNAWPSPSSDST